MKGEYPVTAETIRAARRAQMRERAELRRHGIEFDESGHLRKRPDTSKDLAVTLLWWSTVALIAIWAAVRAWTEMGG